MTRLIDVLLFRQMIAPIILQFLFWAGIGGTIYGTYVLVKLDHWAWWMALIFGTLTTRVLFEFGILAFRSYERLCEVRDLLKQEA
jgi:hypothetical protein